MFGSKILSIVLKNDREYFETKYRIRNDVFGHTLKANFEGYGWWHEKYKICTNIYGAKSDCDKINNLDTKYDIVFLGDSFTEGVGLSWENSYIGKISNKLKDKKILNIQKIENNYVIQNNLQNKNNILLKNLLEPFPMTLKFIISIRRLFLEKSYKQDIKLKDYLSEDFYLTNWLNTNNLTNTKDEISYDKLIHKSLDIMEKIYKILKQKNIKLSIVVYPHPVQIINNNLNSRNERMWKKFCLQKCDKFINLSSYFENIKLSELETINKYYINGDIHFNQYGSELISELFLENFN